MGQSTEELSTQIAGTRENLASDLDALQDRVSPSAIVERRKEAARGRLRSVRDKVMGTAHDTRTTAAAGAGSAVGTAKDSAHGAVGSAQSAVGSARDAASGAADTAQEKFQGAPLAAGLVAFGAGMIIASLFPAAEKETVVAAKVVDTAKEQGQPLVEQAKSVGSDIAQQAGEQAKQAAQEVKDTAQQGAEEVKSHGQSAADSVRSEAQSS